MCARRVAFQGRGGSGHPPGLPAKRPDSRGLVFASASTLAIRSSGDIRHAVHGRRLGGRCGLSNERPGERTVAGVNGGQAWLEWKTDRFCVKNGGAGGG